MNSSTRRGRLLWTSFAVLLIGLGATADADEARVVPIPSSIELVGPDAVQQVLLEDRDNQRDLTAQATFEVMNPLVAQVDKSGLVEPRSEGQTTLKIRVGEHAVEVPISVRSFDNPPPIHFGNQVIPIFTKLGCNAGGCHGKSGGQNGFRLSLLGFEPQLDYETLVKEGRGRRLFPAAPDHSLLLTKAVASVPHGGGKKLEPDSHEYRLVRRWIAEGMPSGSPDAPYVERIEVYPETRVLSQGSTQQLLVTAVYTDGHREDVTRWAQYESNETDVATVEEGGRVSARDLAGQAAIMARYQGQVSVFRAKVPLGREIAQREDYPVQNYVDELAKKQWDELGLVPSGLCTDAEFIRRASLDLNGTLPTAEETRAFEQSTDPGKRIALIDQLLEKPEYAAFFAQKWSDILRNKRGGDAGMQRLTYRFHDWIRRQLDQNVPFDQFAERIIAATGTSETAPAVVWYRSLKKPDEFVDDTAQVFLGMRLQCAKCHHHPFEKWSEDDYYSFAAFFARVGRKDSVRAKREGRTEQVIFASRDGAVTHPKTNKVMKPRGLGDADPIEVGPNEDPRRKLSQWMSGPENPFFAKAVVNRYWAHFFGRGLVMPIDDMRETNPPTNPELLEALASDFVKSGYDLKHLIRTICTSRLYGLSSQPNEYNARDKQSFARAYPKRMSAEVLLDAISRVTAVPTSFGGLPEGTRAIELPDEAVGTAFLDTFGRPKRDTACECERVTEASLSQSLMLLNSGDVQAKLASDSGRAAALAADPRPEAEKIDELFWEAFGRSPSDSERATALGHIESRPEKKKQAYEDILWALVNAKEFQFID